MNFFFRLVLIYEKYISISEGVFESDEDEDDYIDECSICTESLLYGLIR